MQAYVTVNFNSDDYVVSASLNNAQAIRVWDTRGRFSFRWGICHRQVGPYIIRLGTRIYSSISFVIN